MSNERLRRPQIGVMGSCSDLNYSEEIERIAEETGYLIAQEWLPLKALVDGAIG